MTTEETIATLEARISKAVVDCEAWRRTGLSENYIEAYDLVEALQLQLLRRLRSTRAASLGEKAGRSLRRIQPPPL